MPKSPELAEIEAEIREILADDELTLTERNAKLGDLVKRRREAFARCRDLLKEFALRARGKSQDDADAILRELLESPEFVGALGLAMLFPVFLHGLFQRDSTLRGFPLPTIPIFASIPVPVYRPH